MLGMLFTRPIDYGEIIIYIISSLAVIFLTLPIHEFAHAFAAVKLGDNTPRWQGRLTLNPFAHIDYIGSLCILFFGFGWAKPVGVNNFNFKKPKRDMALTALAGPLSNILMAFVFMVFIYILFALSLISGIWYNVAVFCSFVVQINVSLAVFNLIPIPPLDGSRILAAFLPDRTYYKLMRYERYIYLALILLMFTGRLDAPIRYLSNAIMNFLELICNAIFSIF